jgi:predicted nucleic acid-binding protein
MIVISDSTILIGLVKIGKLDLLKEIFSKIFIPLAKNLGLIYEVRPLVDELMIKKFRISDKIIKKTLKKVGEA